jgi:hypothetical protein
MDVGSRRVTILAGLTFFRVIVYCEHVGRRCVSIDLSGSQAMIVFVMLVGPGEAAIAIDSLTWALKLYPGTIAWVREDKTSDGTLEKLDRFARSCDGRVFLESNPAPQGYSGIAVSMFRLYESLISRFPKLDMVIQLDPDACLLREGIVELARERFLRHGPGMIGSYMINAFGEARSHRSWRNRFIRDMLPLGPDLKTKQLRFGLPFYLRYLFRALKNNYKLGHHVLAAFYILHGDTIRALEAIGFWAAMPEEGTRQVKLDDPLLSLGVFAVGHKLMEINDASSGDVQTWIQYRPPIPLSAKEIIDRRIIAIHPVKADKDGSALRIELRALFASLPLSEPSR